MHGRDILLQGQGGQVADIAECKVEYVERLPFQAIMCTLAQIRPTGKEWSSEAGDRIFDMTRDMDTDEAMMIDCVVVEIVEDQYRVKLRNGLNLAQDLVDSGLAEWLENSVESSFDSLEQHGDKISDEATEWDILNGLPGDILNMTELYAATREGHLQLLRPFQSHQPSLSSCRLPARSPRTCPAWPL